jgi:hypothetical protein
MIRLPKSAENKFLQIHVPGFERLTKVTKLLATQMTLFGGKLERFAMSDTFTRAYLTLISKRS